MPQITVISQSGEKSITGQIKKEETLLHGLQRLGIHMPGNCGGNGTCGKCTVQFGKEAPAPHAEDEILSAEQREGGIRLSCCHNIEKDETIRLLGEMYLPEEKAPKMQILGMAEGAKKERGESVYTMIVDVGTTTLAAAMVREGDFQIERVLTRVNSQRRFGSDVISRIQAANEGNGAELKKAIWEDILAIWRDFEADKKALEENGAAEGQAAKKLTWKKIVISGNTVMEHLLMGYSCKGLGEAPFAPVSLALTKKPLKEIYEAAGSWKETEVTLLPGISAFVGADILSGLFAVSMDKKDKPVLFVDLGTNGEMALGNKERLLVTATSAGPAFEGANISAGVAGIEGAIQQVNLLGKRLQLTTIGKKPAIGICGTGVLELVCELYKTGIIDAHGTLKEEYQASGYPLGQRPDGSSILFTQEDVRQLQMAKAAIRSGIDLLLQNYGITEEEVAEVYLAGGFGCSLNVYKAASIGLIPRKLVKKTKALGNTSLQGGYQYAKEIREKLQVKGESAGAQESGHIQEESTGAQESGQMQEESAKTRMKYLAEHAEVLNLAMLPEFEERYIKNMDF